MSSYGAFLETKRRRLDDVGIIVDPGSLHESLFGFQREVTSWALRRGRCAIWADTGLGKTRMQVEWANHAGDRSLIVAPLSVARQTVKESGAIDVDVRYVRDGDDAKGPGVWITNYEMVDRFDAPTFDAVVLDESSILKNVTGSTRLALTKQWANTRHRLCCTATPAPNDVSELCNHAEFLSVMPRSEMLAAYFVHDDEGWRLKGHAAGPMYDFISEWARAFRRPSDMGYPDKGYDLPPLRIHAEIVKAPVESPGQLFPTELGGVSGRATVRRATLDARVARALELAAGKDQWIIWCGLNAESEAITNALSDAVNVVGSWSPEAKAEALEAFQDGAIRVLVTKPSIAGFGMNFQNCHRMAFLGLSDSYESYYQAIRRCYRFGQTSPVDAHVIVSELEQEIVANVRAKEVESSRLTDALVGHLMREAVLV